MCGRGAGAAGTRYNCGCDYSALTDLVACSPGCDGVPGSGKSFDKCGRCGGDGSTCKGCDGVELSGTVFDSLGRCVPLKSHPTGCDGVVNSHKRADKCGDCGGDGSRCAGQQISCTDSAQEPDDCGVCRDPSAPRDLKQMSCFGCDGIAFSGKLVDRCGVCDGDGRSCADKLNCIVTPCEFLQRPDYRFENPQRLEIWDRCWVYDACGVCGGLGGTCAADQSSVTQANAVSWVNDLAQVVTAIVRLDIDDGQLDASKSAGADALLGHIRTAIREAAGMVTSKTGQLIHVIDRADHVVIRSICGKEQVCVEFQNAQIHGTTATIRNALMPANENCLADAARRKWCTAGCKSCDVQAKTRPSSGYSDVSVRIVTNRRDQLRQKLREVTFQQKFSTQMQLLTGDSSKMFWEVPPCFGYDICGTWCGDGRGCESCGRCGRDASTGQCITMDACGVCNGDGSSCKGCDGKSFSGLVYDACKVCGGDNSTCLGCDGVVNSGKMKDRYVELKPHMLFMCHMLTFASAGAGFATETISKWMRVDAVPRMRLGASTTPPTFSVRPCVRQSPKAAWAAMENQTPGALLTHARFVAATTCVNFKSSTW